jgi:putative membrane protein
MFLTAAEADAIDAQVARVESRTGVQIVTAVVGKSDNYVELPWKAFALGASLAAFGVVAADTWRPEWVTANTALLHVVAILGVAVACALLAVFVPAFGRLFLRATRRDIEVRHYAQSLFLTRELFRTRQRTGVLVLISLFERRIEILPDTGLHDRVSEADWRGVVSRMTPLLREVRPFHALQEGLAALEALLVAKGLRTPTAGVPGNELSDRPIEEPGA